MENMELRTKRQITNFCAILPVKLQHQIIHQFRSSNCSVQNSYVKFYFLPLFLHYNSLFLQAVATMQPLSTWNMLVHTGMSCKCKIHSRLQRPSYTYTYTCWQELRRFTGTVHLWYLHGSFWQGIIPILGEVTQLLQGHRACIGQS